MRISETKICSRPDLVTLEAIPFGGLFSEVDYAEHLNKSTSISGILNNTRQGLAK